MSSLPDRIGDRQFLLSKMDEFITAHYADGKSFALLLININQFRRFNIAQGYQTADALLVAFASRLIELSRDQDCIARVGNAEFVMLLPGILNEGHASLAAIKLLGSLKQPFAIDDDSVNITADIGIVLYPDHSSSVEDLLKKGEMALANVQKSTDSYAIFSEQSSHLDTDTWDIESDLQHAIEKDQFELFFQPQVYLNNGELFGAEALIRWKNGEKGYIRPDLFIPVAENSGHIYKITQWTLNSALWLKQQWPKTLHPTKVAVNISTKMLAEVDFVEMVVNALKIYDTDYNQLTLEITESALVEDLESSFKILEDLKSLGINISIDDFGTGYSSMAYFKSIPANELKIDKSFVCYMLENSMDQHIVKTIIQMAKGFDLKVVAEGIEDQPTFDQLNHLGCDIAQGYHLAKPMPQQAFINWIRAYI